MVHRIATSYAFAMALAWVFVLSLIPWMGSATVLIILNGVLCGCFVALGVAYARLVWGALMGDIQYARVSQMTFGFFLTWVYVAMSLGGSVYSRALDVPLTLPTWTISGRVVIIAAAIAQVTAPDFGLGLFHGRERKTLWASAIAGTLTAFAAIFYQDTTFLF